MELEIISPEKIYFKGETVSVSLPGTYSAFTMLDRHAPIISSLTKGKITYVVDGKNMELFIESGFVESKQNRVTICIEPQKQIKE